MNRKLYEAMRAEAGQELRHRLGLGPGEKIEMAVVLGTGWGNAFPFQADRTAEMANIAAFQGLEVLEGHARRFEIGTIELEHGRKVRIVVLRGRIHMNESTFDLRVRALVRLQIDVLIELGVEKFLLTAAVGALRKEIEPRRVMIIEAFPSYGQDVMPAFPGEFVNIEEALDQDMINHLDTPWAIGPYIFFQGPHFENTQHDKPAMRALGGAVVGMSVKPEVFTVAAARQLRGMKNLHVVALGYVSNDPTETMSDDEHRRRALEDAQMLSDALLLTINRWSD